MSGFGGIIVNGSEEFKPIYKPAVKETKAKLVKPKTTKVKHSKSKKGKVTKNISKKIEKNTKRFGVKRSFLQKTNKLPAAGKLAF